MAITVTDLLLFLLLLVTVTGFRLANIWCSMGGRIAA